MYIKHGPKIEMTISFSDDGPTIGVQAIQNAFNFAREQLPDSECVSMVIKIEAVAYINPPIPNYDSRARRTQPNQG